MQGWPWESTGGQPSHRSRDELGVLVVAQTPEIARQVARHLQTAAANRHTLQISASCADAERMLRSATTAFADVPAPPTDAIDVVLLDPYVADASGIDALERLRRAAPTVPIVVMADARGWNALDENEESLALHLLSRGAQELVPVDRVDSTTFWRTLERAVARHSVVAALERSREAAAHRATHDPLTGLPNRQLFLDRLDQALMLSGRYGRKTGVLFIDLDDFKAINDSYGHVIGDQLLASMAARLLRCVRKSDAVGRLGGDEFTVLLPDVRSRRDLLHVQRTIGAALLAPHELGDGLVLPVRASIGAAMAPLDGETPRALLEAADAAMYRAKESTVPPSPAVNHPSTGEFVRVGAPSTVPVEASRSPITEDELRQALARGEFAVHYQPIVDALTERITAVEALLRWRSPSRGLVDAAAFLPLAEDTGLIVPIGDLVLESAAHAARRWRERMGEGGSAFRVHVNVSPIQLKERDVTARVARALAGAQCPADAITLEVSERCALPDAQPVLDALDELRRIGVRLVVDDFGVGYSSLAFIRTAPVHAVKIDRSFVQRLTSDNRDVAIVSSIIRLARGLGLGVIAEGVESEGQAKLLRFQRCAQLQGWLFGTAVTTEAIDAMLAAPRRVVLEDDQVAVSPSQDGPSFSYASTIG
jgi:diguanylate cyclase (GGDEF)-like protein